VTDDDDLFAFIGGSIDSVWALELLLLLKRDRDRAWEPDTLIRELRSSPVVIEEALKGLRDAGLVTPDGRGYRYWPASPRLDELVSSLERAYAATPMTVIKAVVTSRTEKLRAFSDAFKLKD
jgi:hypothetical protein